VAPIAQLAEAADLKSAQCRFESDWGHQSPYGSRFLDQGSAFRVVAWTSAANHGSEWTTEAADFRSAELCLLSQLLRYIRRSAA
jgi:hypothetical protein